MTVGENIRRIRQERGLTLKQLGEMVGVSEAYIRAYESGRRNPKLKSLEALAQALAVNVEVLTNSDFDGIKAMHRLFQVFRQYDGHLFEYQDQDGNDMVAVSFGTLSLMRSWCDRYEEYMKELEGLLAGVPTEEKEEALQYYSDYFADAGKENEGEVISELGSPQKVAALIKAGLKSGGMDEIGRAHV